ncbi:MAG: adenylosuccinate synthase [Nitrospinota bacterium]
MPVSVLVGMQWGDEGKGKIVDLLSEKNDVIARFQGGANAGHTVVINGREFILHIIPSGILRPGKICLIGSGVVVDPEALLKEIEELAQSGIDVSGRLIISPRAHCILPVHKELDSASENMKSQKKIGTTRKGIGPAYSDKTQRIGIPVSFLDDREKLEQAVNAMVERHNPLLEHFYGGATMDAKKVLKAIMEIAPKITKYIGDTRSVIRDSIRQNKNILCEGAQGTMLDIDHGSYPFVTSSNTISGGACTGLGIPPNKIDAIIGVIKAYTTRVGEGPFPTELSDSDGTMLQDEGREFGATTGRPRRCGWFDAVIGRYAAELNGITEIVITKLDVLDKMKKIKVCVGYEHKGERIENITDDVSILENVTPVYEHLDGWEAKTAGVTRLDRLPANARSYIDFLQEQVGVKASLISTGQDRNASIDASAA